MGGGHGTEPFRRAFRGDVALGRGEHFESNHEFLHCGGAEERRVVVGVEAPMFMIAAVRGSLVEAHRVGEGSFEEVIEADGDLVDDVGESGLFRFAELGEVFYGAAREQHYFERPLRPAGDEGDSAFVFANDALAPVEFDGEVIGQHGGAVALVVFALAGVLFFDLGGE